MTINIYLFYKHLPIRHGKTVPALSIISYFTKRKENKNGKVDPVTCTIAEADELFEEDKYLESYNILINSRVYSVLYINNNNFILIIINSINISYSLILIQNDDNVEIQWRVCRALYKMSRTDIYAKSTKDEMIQDAYDLICEIEKHNSNNANVQKWMAILLDAKLRVENKFSRIEDNIKIKEHLTVNCLFLS